MGTDYFFWLDFLCFDYIPGLEDRIALLRLCQNIIEFIVGGQHDRIHISIPGALTIRQTQTSADHLLTQNFGCCRPKRDDGIEVVDIPSFFEHIDMDHDLHRIFGILHVQKQTGVCLSLGAFLLGMDDDCFIAVCAVAEFIGFDKTFHPRCVVSILTHNKHKRLHDRLAVIGGIDLQLAFGAFVTGYAVQEHHFIELLVTEIIKIDVGAGDRKRGAGITILDGLGQRILKYHILERHLFCTLGHKRRGGQFQSEQWFQFVKSLCAFFCTIMVRFIHNKHQIRQIGKVLVERVTDDLVHLLHVCAFLIELIDVIYENADIRRKNR